MWPKGLLTLLLLAGPIPSVLSKRVSVPRSHDTHNYYILHHNHESVLLASPEECAHALNTELVEQVGELQHHWLVRAQTILSRSQFGLGDYDVVLARFDALRRRASQSSLNARSHILDLRVTSSIHSLERQIPRQRVKKRVPIPTPISTLSTGLLPSRASNESGRVIKALQIQDPSFYQQWHLMNDLKPQYDLNVSGVWQQGITGKGVHVAVADDGVDSESDDLAPNFDAEGSWDFIDHTALPRPRFPEDNHGTRCAGEIAAAKNDACGVGVAYNSRIAGIRVLGGDITDADEAAALNYNYQSTDIYSCSWGPTDDGRTLEEPAEIIQKAFVNGVQKGRDGKGSVFVFASGNGAGNWDQCNFDGYTNSIYSVTVGAVDENGQHPYYSEGCAANMVVAYSSGLIGRKIFTTDLGKDKCTDAHSGTSASAPLAAGIIALALQVRPELSWRDVQHLCVRTAQHINPSDPDWDTTATGRPFSYKYGFGSLDAWAFVELARSWKLVKPQAWIEFGPIRMDGSKENLNTSLWVDADSGGGVPSTSEGLESQISVTEESLERYNFEALEHITVKVWITHGRRGDVTVDLVSPSGIVSVLAAPRSFDDDISGFMGWTFMSLKHWGEDPIGVWTIRVKVLDTAEYNGTFIGWSMTLWGESIDASRATLWKFPGEHVFSPSPASLSDVPGSPSSNTPAAAPPSTLGSTTVTGSHKGSPFSAAVIILAHHPWLTITFVLLIFFLPAFVWYEIGRRKRLLLAIGYTAVRGEEALSMSEADHERPSSDRVLPPRVKGATIDAASDEHNWSVP